MLADEKQALISQISEVRERINALIDDVDPNVMIHRKSRWRLRDVLAHMVAWQQEAVAAAEAHISEQPELPLQEMETFNQAAYEAFKDTDYQEIYGMWQAAYDALKDIVQRAPAHCWDVEFTNSWGLKATLTQHIRSILAHDIEHEAEIKAALNDGVTS